MARRPTSRYSNTDVIIEKLLSLNCKVDWYVLNLSMLSNLRLKILESCNQSIGA